MRKVTGAWARGMALLVAVPLALAACTSDGSDSKAAHLAASHAPPPTPVSLAVTPADGAAKQPVSTEIGTTVSGGTVSEVTLTADDGAKVTGGMRPDGTSWVPASPLKYGKRYTASVTATGSSGQKQTKTTTFSTMDKPRSFIQSNLNLLSGKTYGVAMPVVVQFTPGIPKKDRATVQKRMFVTTNPPQPGVWHWIDNGTQAYYRAQKYWQPQTMLTVRVALEGIPLSNQRYGDTDGTATAKIGSRFEVKVNNSSKKLSAYDNGTLVKTMPVSLGKASTPSSSGTMVVMEKHESTIFDTFAELGPVEGYRTRVEFAQRLTWGGEFIHSAPWSVGDQGHRNVSHGCINVSPRNAKWLFDHTKVGDPVTVTGTTHNLDPGNGWTAWNMSWDEFIKGSALPVPSGLAPAASASAAPSVSPTG